MLPNGLAEPQLCCPEEDCLRAGRQLQNRPTKVVALGESDLEDIGGRIERRMGKWEMGRKTTGKAGVGMSKEVQLGLGN